MYFLRQIIGTQSLTFGTDSPSLDVIEVCPTVIKVKDDLAGDHDIGEYKWDPEGSDFKGKPKQNRFAMGMDSPSPGWGSARTDYLGRDHP